MSAKVRTDLCIEDSNGDKIIVTPNSEQEGVVAELKAIRSYDDPNEGVVVWLTAADADSLFQFLNTHVDTA